MTVFAIAKVFAIILLASPLVLILVGALCTLIPPAAELLMNLFLSLLGEIPIFELAANAVQVLLDNRKLNADAFLASFMHILVNSMADALILSCCIFAVKASRVFFNRKFEVFDCPMASDPDRRADRSGCNEAEKHSAADGAEYIFPGGYCRTVPVRNRNYAGAAHIQPDIQKPPCRLYDPHDDGYPFGYVYCHERGIADYLHHGRSTVCGAGRQLWRMAAVLRPVGGSDGGHLVAVRHPWFG